MLKDIRKEHTSKEVPNMLSLTKDMTEAEPGAVERIERI